MEFDDYLKRVEPIVDRYDRLEKKAELIKLAINGLNYEVVKVLDMIDATDDISKKEKLEKHLDEIGYNIDKLSEEYYLVMEKLSLL